ncbi:CvpA family protein [Cereibacter changlensis]|jgi:membrane protein required for colicin V production|uniref:Colicin V production CvpA n=2 Tax=Cereibacter changlensis TaxID=402884 RepID=A0A2T4JYK8_9RHOB|nr:CvpA family protein [Cereibacter changlensis]PTE22985.1 colicin V production CvpA [Cereibacter changlensis JA139]PZX57148.1 membrane protein required for colicin V production [Cereibacter changlensis]TKA95825.1 CvpA family protein [Cereibacter changlensis]
MEGFTIIDAVVAVVIVLSAILAYSRGVVREIMAIAGWVGAAVIAFLFAAAAQPLIKELPVIGEFLSDSCELSIIAAFAAVFALGLVVMSLFTPLFSSVIQRSALGGVDQGLGFLFGVLRGILLVAVAFIVYDRAMGTERVPVVDNSRSANVFASFQSGINDNIPSDAPGWIVARYEQLVSSCAAPATPVPATTAPAAPAAPAN